MLGDSKMQYNVTAIYIRLNESGAMGTKSSEHSMWKWILLARQGLHRGRNDAGYWYLGGTSVLVLEEGGNVQAKADWLRLQMGSWPS